MTKLQTLREEKEDEEDRKKIKKTVLILTKNNDIYNTGIVTSNGKAIYVFMDLILGTRICVNQNITSFHNL